MPTNSQTSVKQRYYELICEALESPVHGSWMTREIMERHNSQLSLCQDGVSHEGFVYSWILAPSQEDAPRKL